MNKGNLLIIDDEPLIVKNLKISLEDYAQEIFVAHNGLEALDILAVEAIQCVICDINMPKMNGVEVIKKLRALGNKVPVIFYTGHGNQDLMLEAAKHGAFDFLDKPDLEGLEEVVSKGMKEGFVREAKKGSSQELNSFLSEFSKMLQK